MPYNKIYKLAEEAGIPAQEIATNLRHLAGNTLDLIKEEYPDMQVNKAKGIPVEEGFQIARMQGQGVVIQFANHPIEDYPDIALWIRNNVPFSQLHLLYYNVPPTNRLSCAIGVAFGSTTNVPQIATVFNGKVIKTYLAKYNG